MKILFVTRKFPPSVGGMQLFARDLSQALTAKVELKLLKWGYGGRLAAVLLAVPYLFIRSFFALLTGKYSVVHAQDTVVAPGCFLLAKLFRKHFTVVVHGLDITYKNPLFRAVVPGVVRRADAVICISSTAADSAREAGVAAEKLHVIPLAVNDDIFGLANRRALLQSLDMDEDSQLLLTVGRLVKRKGVVWFIENVLPQLAGYFPKLVYLVAGDGPDKSAIEAAIMKTRLQAHVRLLGKTSPELLAAAYNGADVFVMPNIKVPGDMEGFGLVLLEAALCERPIVAADFEGIKDAVVNGRNGQLVPSGDAVAFGDEIKRFLQDPRQAAVFGANARQFTLQNYTWETIAERYLEVYKRLGLQ